MTRTERVAKLKTIAKERVLVFDGSWGVLIQNKGLDEADYRGDRFTGFKGQMKGNNDILCLTRPDIIESIHNDYFGGRCGHFRNQYVLFHHHRAG
jgi:5-methyltetrahydrofolate--homocysteine methyltransferase